MSLADNVLKVSSHNPDQEHANDEMSIDYTGDEIEIGFNVNYLLEALKACQSNNINLGLLDPNTSCTFHAEEDEDTLYLIMPMRL